MAMDVHMGQPYPKGFIGQLYTPRSGSIAEGRESCILSARDTQR
jgi:hypothetical protein